MGTYIVNQVHGPVVTVRAALVDGPDIRWIDVNRPDVKQHVGQHVLRSQCEAITVLKKKIECDGADVSLELSLLVDEDGHDKDLPRGRMTPTVYGPCVLYASWKRIEHHARMSHLTGSVDLHSVLDLARIPRLLQLWNDTRIPIVMPDGIETLDGLTRDAAAALLDSPDMVRFRAAMRVLDGFSVNLAAAQPALTRATAVEAWDVLQHTVDNAADVDERPRLVAAPRRRGEREFPE
jgi:hypothetical protein